MILVAQSTLFYLVASLPVVHLVVSIVIGVLAYGNKYGLVWSLQREEVIGVDLTLRAALVWR